MTTSIHHRSGALALAVAAAIAAPATAQTASGLDSSSPFGQRALPQFGSAVTPSFPWLSATGLWQYAADGADTQEQMAREHGLRSPASLSVQQAFDQFDRHWVTGEQALAAGGSTTLSLEYRRSGESGGDAGALQLAGFSLLSHRANGAEMSIGTGGMAGNYFGAGGLRTAAGDATQGLPVLGNPYLSLVPSASHAGLSREVGGIRIKFGILKTGLNHLMSTRAFDPDHLSPALMTVQPRINGRVLEFSKSFDNAALSLSLMRSRERGSLGGAPRTVTSFGLGAATSSLQLTGVWLVAPKIALAAQASYGRTPPQRVIGFGADVGATRSNAFSVGLVASDRYRTGDRFSIALSQPIRVYDGVIATEGAQYRLVSAVPQGRELLTEMNYVTPLGKTAYAGWAVSLRRHPNNVAEAPLEKLVAVRYVKQF